MSFRLFSLICVYCFAAVLFDVGVARAQYPAQRWIRQGDSLLAAGELKAAEKAYKRALKIDKKAVEAWRGRGKIDFAKQNWGDCAGKFDRVLKLRPDDLEALYYRAICYREMGKTKALLFRKLDWDISKKLFLRVLERNRHFRDVLLQFAVLKKYRGKYEEAVALAQEQIEIRPDLADAHTRLYEFYRSLIRHRGGEEAENWLKQQSWPQARLALAELWRRKGHLQQADSLLQQLLEEAPQMSVQPVLLALAKIAYARGQDERGEAYYWQAVDAIASDVDAQMVFDNLKYILTDRELEDFRRLGGSEAKIEFFHRFWAERNPTPAAPVNARLREHFRRLMFAEKYYEYDGFKTRFNSPDKFKYLHFPATYALNHEFNDKGLVYLRHGEPDDRQVTVAENSLANESWRYFARGDQPELIFHFVVDENAAGSNWRLTPLLTDPAMLADRLDWGPVYHRLLMAEPVERLQMENEMIEENVKYVDVGLSTERHSWPDSIKPLDFRFTAATFRGAKDSTLVEVFYAIPMDLLRQAPETVRPLRLVQGIALEDSNWVPRARKNRVTAMEGDVLQASAGKFFIERFLMTARPGKYRLSLQAQVEGTGLLGGYQTELSVPNYHHSQLSLSDLQLAYQIRPAGNARDKFTKNGLQVVVNPTMVFDRKKPVYAYFEIYHLQPGADGTAHYRIEYTLKLLKSRKRGLKKVFGFLGGGGKSSISLSTDREQPGDSAIEWVSFDVSKLKPGKYQMILRIRDLTGGGEVEKSRELWLD